MSFLVCQPEPLEKPPDRAGIDRHAPLCLQARRHCIERGLAFGIHLRTHPIFMRTGHRITGSRTGQNTQRSKRAGPGWEYVHVCVDDASRLAFTKVHPDEKAVSAVAHLHSAVAWYASMGITVARVMTDNGSCYKSHAFKAACAELGIRHIRTKPYTPQSNGKAERFIQTALREWAYARAYKTSKQRAADLPVWTHLYNWHRPHSALKSKPPSSRLGLDRNNILRFLN